MSDTESECSRPRAFEGESSSGSSTAELDSTESESTNVEIVEEPSTSGRGTEVAKVSIATLREGVLIVVQGRQRVPMAKPKGLVFRVDFLEANALTEGELAEIRAEYHIPDSVV